MSDTSYFEPGDHPCEFIAVEVATLVTVHQVPHFGEVRLVDFAFHVVITETSCFVLVELVIAVFIVRTPDRFDPLEHILVDVLIHVILKVGDLVLSQTSSEYLTLNDRVEEESYRVIRLEDHFI